MNAGMNRWLVAGTWLTAVFALISASTKGAIGVGAMWSLPVAIGVTLAAMGWPDKPASRIVAALGVVWQVALIGAYWPFAAAEADPNAVTGPMRWSIHSILILVVLAALALAFVAIYLLPAIGLMGRIKRAAFAVAKRTPDTLEKVELAFAKDTGLIGLWQEYMGQVRPATSGNALQANSSHASARDLFDPSTVAHTRLKLDFFRNLPGVFTGIGIIGTFSGLITGLRAFQISQDPAVVQRSLESLLTGVWGAFLISALAIALAIVVTIAEKLVASALSHHLEVFAAGLDLMFPPRPQIESDSWMPRLIDALTHFTQRIDAAPTQAALSVHAQQAHTPDAVQPSTAMGSAGQDVMVPMSSSPHQGQPAAYASALDAPRGFAMAASTQKQTAESQDLAQATRTATLALADVASRIPDMLAGTLHDASQGQQQAAQVMKTLSSKLENVASGIEFSARKTLETVAARLMQAETHTSARHHEVSQQLLTVVARLDALCGSLQQDRTLQARGSASARHTAEMAAATHYGGRDDMGGLRHAHHTLADRGNGRGRGISSAALHAEGHIDLLDGAHPSSNGRLSNYSQLADDAAWEEPASETNRFAL